MLSSVYSWKPFSGLFHHTLLALLSQILQMVVCDADLITLNNSSPKWGEVYVIKRRPVSEHTRSHHSPGELVMLHYSLMMNVCHCDCTRHRQWPVCSSLLLRKLEMKVHLYLSRVKAFAHSLRLHCWEHCSVWRKYLVSFCSGWQIALHLLRLNSLAFQILSGGR